MVRRGQQSRRAVKRAAAEVVKQVESPTGAYRSPPREDCVEHRWRELVDDAGTIRVSYWVWRHEGRVVDFVILIELTDWEAWAEISRIDCCWGFCHVHPPNRPTEHSPLHRLDVVDDVEDAYIVAVATAEKIARTIRGTRGVDHE